MGTLGNLGNKRNKRHFLAFEVEAKIEELCLIHEKFLDNLINLHQFKLCDKENLNLYALKFKKFDTKLRVKNLASFLVVIYIGSKNIYFRAFKRKLVVILNLESYQSTS